MKTYKKETIDMKNYINKETMKTAGTVAGKIGKAIVIEGVKGVLLKGAAKVITTSFDSGIEGVKKLTIDDYVGNKKKNPVPVIELKSEEAKVVADVVVDVVEKRNQD